MKARHLGRSTLLAGLVLIGLANLTSRVILPPLYDGVVNIEPYRYLQPPPGAPGDPTSYTHTEALQGGSTPPLIGATLENPPQAQLLASQGSFTVPSGTTSVIVTIKPVPPPALPASGHITGNVYQLTVTTASGALLEAKSLSPVSIVLRAPAGVNEGTIALFQGVAWHSLQTDPAGLPSMFVSNTTALGEFAVIAPGPAPSTAASPIATAAGSSTQPAPSGGLPTASATTVPVSSPSVAPVVPPPPAATGPLGDPIALAVIAVLLVLSAVAIAVAWRRSRRPRRKGMARRRR